MARPLYIERALFLVGDRSAGKSTHLRSMFEDCRFHTFGEIPTPAETRETVKLSNERNLFIRIMSAHETELTLKQYFDKIEEKCQPGRWCFAGALWPAPGNKIKENLAEIIEAFVDRFEPERVRLCFLSPDHNNKLITNFINVNDQIARLRKIDGVECAVIDGYLNDIHPMTASGLFLADFFDFT